MKCNQCGTEFEGKFCPNCGKSVTTGAEQIISANNSYIPPVPPSKPVKTKKKKPLYKRWWFILFVIIVVIAVVKNISNEKKEKLVWKDIVLGEMLPQPKSDSGEIFINTEKELSVSVYKMSSSDYSDYITQCSDKGFTVEAKNDSSSFEAYNENGYELNLIFSDSSDSILNITLKAPEEMKEIQWPESTVGSLLPVPKSTSGYFSYEHDDSFLVYIGNTTPDEFSEYAVLCSDNGFNVDYDKGDTFYYAYNSDKYKLSLKYEGNNIMSIEIKSPDKSSSEAPPSSSSSLSSASESSSDEIPVSDTDTGEIRKDFKEAMDSYEEFMNEYVSFMERYEASDGTDAKLLLDYASYMEKYADFTDKFSKWENEDMNDAETNYYIDVQARVSKKLLDIAQ